VSALQSKADAHGSRRGHEDLKESIFGGARCEGVTVYGHDEVPSLGFGRSRNAKESQRICQFGALLIRLECDGTRQKQQT